MKKFLAVLTAAAGLAAAMVPAQAAEKLMTLSCRGGGKMVIEKLDTVWNIKFIRAPLPVVARPLEKGECAFRDVDFPDLSTGLLFMQTIQPRALEMLAAAKGGSFDAEVVQSGAFFVVKTVGRVDVDDGEPEDEVAEADDGDDGDFVDDDIAGGDGLCAASKATVSIPEPNLKKLNVRTKPNGKVVAQIPEGKVVTVVGPCGSEAAAGLVAKKNDASGWCQIDKPVGCVMAKYLDFDGGGGLDNAAGFNKSKSKGKTSNNAP